MATLLQPRLALLVEKKRQELEISIQGACNILTRMERSLESNADLAVTCVDDFHRECRAISRLYAELQMLESVARAGWERGTPSGRTRRISEKDQEIP